MKNTENLSKEIKVIKKNQMEIIELNNAVKETETLDEWTQQQGGFDREQN